jgi:hypothetical protein
VADDTQRFQTYDQRTGRLERQSIVVDEEFDVTVDGQALDTLSGSGKAVANLALRLGLGQVLTNRCSRCSSVTRSTQAWMSIGRADVKHSQSDETDRLAKLYL